MGIGGIENDHIISRHRGTIDNELPETKKVIIRIGSNDVAKGAPPERIVNNVESADNRVLQVNSKVKVAISAIFLQGTELAQNNLNISKTNLLLRDLCYHQVWDFLDHGNINFNHLDPGGMHLTSEENHLFAKNITNYVLRR